MIYKQLYHWLLGIINLKNDSMDHIFIATDLCIRIFNRTFEKQKSRAVKWMQSSNVYSD